MKNKKITITIFIVYLLILFRLTVFRNDFFEHDLFSSGKINLVPFTDLLNLNFKQFIYLVFGNIVVFIPLGILIPMIFNEKMSFLKISICGGSLSIIIEFLQFMFGVGVTEIDDIILNVLGTLIGCFLYKSNFDILKANKKYHICLAGLIWFIAGFNVAKVGMSATYEDWKLIYILLSILVFSLFTYFIFLKLVKKHTKRILSFEDEKVLILKFFDLKSYILMAVMITGGLLLRNSGWLPGTYIRTFYLGLGCSLMLAGILFFVNFIKLVSKPELHKS